MKKIWKKGAAIVLAAVLAVSMMSGCSKKTKTYVVLNDNLGSEEYGVGLRKGDVALGLEIQKQMDAMIADGTAKTISQKWFDSDIMIKDAKYIKESTAPAGDTSLTDLKKRGTLILGLDDNFPPMGFRDENNKIVGFDIDLATEVAKRMGVTLTLQPIDWDSKELELNGGKIDCIWNGLSITDERVAAMFFAKPYIENDQVIIVPEGSSIKTKENLKGKTVGLQKGSSSLDALNADPVSKEVKQIVEYPDNVAAFMDLKAGRIDAFVVDEVAGRYIMSSEKD